MNWYAKKYEFSINITSCIVQLLNITPLDDIFESYKVLSGFSIINPV